MSAGELVAALALILSLILGIVVIVQSLRLSRLEKQWRALRRGSGLSAGPVSLVELIEGQGANLEATRSDLEALKQAVGTIEGSVARSVQCVGLVRFNPFQDTGGDQSFALALLDRQGNGVVMSSLHSRTITRFYAKPVKGGTSHLPLSTEEVQAVQEAMGNAKNVRGNTNTTGNAPATTDSVTVNAVKSDR